MTRPVPAGPVRVANADGPTVPRAIAMNLAGVLEHPQMEASPYLVDADGRPYVPIGDGGVVLGVALGDSVFAFDAEHASPAAAIVHPDPAARHALTALACLGNRVTVRSGSAAGAHGVVLGKRGEAGRVLAWFVPEVLSQLAPGDAVTVRGFGQGGQLPADLHEAGARVLNVDPALLERLPLAVGQSSVRAQVRGIVGSSVVGNGIGRPAHQWDLDVQVDAGSAESLGLVGLRLGDLLAVRNLDVRHNAGYRRGWTTIGVVVTTTSPRPGHGVGLLPILCAAQESLEVDVQEAAHVGVSTEMLGSLLW